MLSRPGEAASAVTLYYLLIIGTGMVQFLFWLYAAFVADLVHPSMDRRHRVLLLVTSVVMPLGSALLVLWMRDHASGRNPEVLFLLVIGISVAVRIGRRRFGIR